MHSTTPGLFIVEVRVGDLGRRRMKRDGLARHARVGGGYRFEIDADVRVSGKTIALHLPPPSHQRVPRRETNPGS